MVLLRAEHRQPADDEEGEGGADRERAVRGAGRATQRARCASGRGLPLNIIPSEKLSNVLCKFVNKVPRK